MNRKYQNRRKQPVAIAKAVRADGAAIVAAASTFFVIISLALRAML